MNKPKDKAYNKVSDDSLWRRTTKDITGRDRIILNVLSSWGGYLVFFVAGFVMPRMIDHHVGQFNLGIWDFAWSLVNYLNLAGLGVGSSVNRYVAKYRVSNDIESLQKAVSSVVCIQICVSLFVLMVTALLVWLLPSFFSDRLGSECGVARRVVGLLGASLAVQMVFDAFRGVITGCHRWDLHNGINAGSRAITVALMVIVLLLGGGLCYLALMNLCIVTVTEVVRMTLANRVCPELEVRLKYAERLHVKKMLLFGIRSFIASLPPLILMQTANILVVSFLGPAALAVFARPVALVRHIETFINKFAFVLTPTAGSLQESGRGTELRRFLLDSTRYGVALTLPMILLLSIYGDFILRIWMGPQYANGLVPAILAIGYFLPISQSTIMRILIGINLHGRIGLMSLAITIAGFAICTIIISAFGWDLPRVALLVSIPLSIGNGVFVPICACRKLNIPITEYISHVFLGPCACGLVFALCLIISRVLFSNNMLYTIGCGGISGVLVLALLYWRYILPEPFRRKISVSVKKKFRIRRPRVDEN